jgi:hypothetical protein
VLQEKIAKVIPELQPSVEVRNGIFSYIMDEKIREQKEQEKIANAFADKEKQEKAIEEIKEEKESAYVDEIKPKKNIAINFGLIKKIGYVLIGIAIIIAAYVFITSSKGWEVISITGQPRLDNSPMKSSDGFASESIIETNEFSSVTLMMPELGKLLVDNSTTVSRTKNSNEIKLDKGQIRKV